LKTYENIGSEGEEASPNGGIVATRAERGLGKKQKRTDAGGKPPFQEENNGAA